MGRAFAPMPSVFDKLKSYEQRFEVIQRALQDLSEAETSQMRLPAVKHPLIPPKPIQDYFALRDSYLDLASKSFRERYKSFPERILSSFHARFMPSRKFVDYVLYWTASRSARHGTHGNATGRTHHWRFTRATPFKEDIKIAEAAVDLYKYASSTLKLPRSISSDSAISVHLANGGKPDDGFKVVEQMRKEGLILKDSVFGCVISSYGRAGDFQAALKVFRSFSNKSQHSYSAVIAACASSRNFGLARELYTEMQRRPDWEPSALVSDTLLYYSSRFVLVDDIEFLLQDRTKHKLPLPQTNLVLPVSRALADVNRCSAAFDFLKPYPPADSINGFVGIAVSRYKHNDIDGGNKAVEMARSAGLGQQREAGSGKDFHLVHELMIVRSISRGKNFELARQTFIEHVLPHASKISYASAYLLSSIITMLFKNISFCSDLDAALSLFDAILKSRCRLSAQSINAMAICFSRLTSSDGVLKFLYRIEREANIHPRRRLRALLLAASSGGCADAVIQLLSSHALSSPPTRSQSISGKIRQRSLKMVRRLALRHHLDPRSQLVPLLKNLQQSSAAPLDPVLVARRVQATSMAYFFGSDSEFEDAFSIACRRQVVVYGQFLVDAISGAVAADRPQEALGLFVYSRHHGANPSTISYCQLLRLCGRHNLRHDALLLFSDFVYDSGHEASIDVVAELMIVFDERMSRDLMPLFFDGIHRSLCGGTSPYYGKDAGVQILRAALSTKVDELARALRVAFSDDASGKMSGSHLQSPAQARFAGQAPISSSAKAASSAAPIAAEPRRAATDKPPAAFPNDRRHPAKKLCATVVLEVAGRIMLRAARLREFYAVIPRFQTQAVFAALLEYARVSGKPEYVGRVKGYLYEGNPPVHQPNVRPMPASLPNRRHFRHPDNSSRSS